MNWQAILNTITPDACQVVLDAFTSADSIFTDFKLNTPLRQAHFLAQAAHETGGFTRLEENLNYSAQSLQLEWPSRFPDAATAAKYARNPEAIANRAYANRMGNVSPGDGWAYRGRGLFQLTGRANYEAMGKRCQIPLAIQPILAMSSRYLLPIALQFWNQLGLSPLADEDDLAGITRHISGSTATVSARAGWLVQWKGALNA